MFPVAAQFEITEKCPHSCFYCYNHFRESPSRRSINLEKIILKISESDLFHITITGGEPFADKNMLLYAISEFRKNNIDVNLNSGLTLSSKNILSKLKEGGVSSILTSAGSYRPEIYEAITNIPGSFKKFTEALYMCNDINIPVSVNMVVHNINKNEVYETGMYFVKNFGIKNFCATPLIPPKGRDVSNMIISSDEYINVLDDLLKLNKETGVFVDSLHPPLPCMFLSTEKYDRFLKRSCAGGRNTLTISSTGEVRPCSHSDRSYGNILESDLRKIHSLMKEWQDDSLIPEECKMCSAVNKCKGGCRVCAEAVFNDIREKDIFMHNPIKNTYIQSKEEQLFKNDRYYTINIGNSRTRNEPSGDVVIYNGTRRVSIFNQKEISFLKFLTNQKYFSIQQISKDVGIPENYIAKFFKKLDALKLLHPHQ